MFEIKNSNKVLNHQKDHYMIETGYRKLKGMHWQPDIFCEVFENKLFIYLFMLSLLSVTNFPRRPSRHRNKQRCIDVYILIQNRGNEGRLRL